MATPTNDVYTVNSGADVYAGLSAFSDYIQPYPGNPQWLMYKNQPFFFVGAGDPEGFLFSGTKQGDGTRSGGIQTTALNNLIADGGNCIYVIASQSPGDGASEDTPWIGDNPSNGVDQDILTQWDGWFATCEANDIIVLFFLYDDHQNAAMVWGTGNTVGATESTYYSDLITKFGPRKNIIWVVSEEYQELGVGSPSAKVSNIAANLRSHADGLGYDITIANHQLDSTTFDFVGDSNVLGYFQQRNGRTVSEMNTDMNTVRTSANANGFFSCMVEAGDAGATKHGASGRQQDWACFMGGTAGIARFEHDPSDTISYTNFPASDKTSDRGDMKVLYDWANNVTTFYTMEPNNALASNGTNYVLANPGQDYILYAVSLTGDMGCQSMTAGTYDAYWIGCDTGEEATVLSISVTTGTNTFTKPGAITTNECAVFLKRRLS